ncbi:MAG: hypothetical protein ABI616_02150 [Pseudomonadota bacterium]
MNRTAHLLLGILIACSSGVACAQVPAVLGTWKLNVEASRFPGPAPQTQVRSYRLIDDGFVIGVAVIVDAQGRPTFLQFAARPDGKDYPEFSTDSAAKYLRDGTKPPRTYAEIPTSDPLKVKWVDKLGGKVIVSGEKWVSADGKKMSFTVYAKDDSGKEVQSLFVFDRTGT